MALTVALSGDWLESQGNKRAVVATIAFDASYPTGGESLTAANLGLGVIDHVTIGAKSGYVFEYDYTNSKVIAYVEEAVAAGGALLEVADTTDLATLTGVRLRAVGR